MNEWHDFCDILPYFGYFYLIYRISNDKLINIIPGMGAKIDKT